MCSVHADKQLLLSLLSLNAQSPVGTVLPEARFTAPLFGGQSLGPAETPTTPVHGGSTPFPRALLPGSSGETRSELTGPCTLPALTKVWGSGWTPARSGSWPGVWSAAGLLSSVAQEALPAARSRAFSQRLPAGCRVCSHGLPAPEDAQMGAILIIAHLLSSHPVPGAAGNRGVGGPSESFPRRLGPHGEEGVGVSVPL